MHMRKSMHSKVRVKSTINGIKEGGYLSGINMYIFRLIEHNILSEVYMYQF